MIKKGLVEVSRRSQGAGATTIVQLSSVGCSRVEVVSRRNDDDHDDYKRVPAGNM